MADRVLRGSRLGAVSYETDRNHDLAPRQVARYRTENGEEFDVPFADDAEIPGTWLCRNGMEGTLIEGGELAEPEKGKVPRTHWDMLRERRSIEELEELLKERLEIIKSGRGGGELFRDGALVLYRRVERGRGSPDSWALKHLRQLSPVRQPGSGVVWTSYSSLHFRRRRLIGT